MIREWSLKLNDDQKSYTLTTEDDDYKWIMPNVAACFDENGFPKPGTIQAFPDKATTGFFTITIPDETGISSIDPEKGA